MKTLSVKASEVDRKWYLVDAENLVLGRMASLIAIRLRGKHKTYYTPHVDCGDNIIVINAEKVRVTGRKAESKKFFWHTGYPGGLKSRTIGAILNSKHPERVIIKAIERMISRNSLGRAQMGKLHVYAGPQHPHEAQKPEFLDIAAMNKKNGWRS